MLGDFVNRTAEAAEIAEEQKNAILTISELRFLLSINEI